MHAFRSVCSSLKWVRGSGKVLLLMDSQFDKCKVFLYSFVCLNVFFFFFTVWLSFNDLFSYCVAYVSCVLFAWFLSKCKFWLLRQFAAINLSNSSMLCNLFVILLFRLPYANCIRISQFVPQFEWKVSLFYECKNFGKNNKCWEKCIEAWLNWFSSLCYVL